MFGLAHYALVHLTKRRAEAMSWLSHALELQLHRGPLFSAQIHCTTMQISLQVQVESCHALLDQLCSVVLLRSTTACAAPSTSLT